MRLASHIRIFRMRMNRGRIRYSHIRIIRKRVFVDGGNDGAVSLPPAHEVSRLCQFFQSAIYRVAPAAAGRSLRLVDEGLHVDVPRRGLAEQMREHPARGPRQALVIDDGVGNDHEAAITL
ncbi:hypothetical protein DF054_23705 [Burkholderia cepacia]|nr:hypothetical protein DF055_21790 [Burkholderia cepacia]RRA04442.1 hypothetical protein DF054_23705 [Burkholderia cepacia]